MTFQIIGPVHPHRIYCAGSFTKLLTTYVTLSLFSEKYSLATILDDENFFDTLCKNKKSREFLTLFQDTIGSKFTLHDICSFYAGLPYTFDLAEEELAIVDSGGAFKHHSIPDEKTFLERCKTKISLIYPDRCKFLYSEISILFLGYFVEQVYEIKMEALYQKYIIDKFKLAHSQFSRTRVPGVHIEDLSDKYDYPSIAILDHGYFCYSNGYYTTLHDLKILLENFLSEPIFQFMTDINHGRAASNRLMNGLTVEIRKVGDDIIYGYEGLSFSGCNIWAYSTKHKKGYITFSNDEEAVYGVIYGQWGYEKFDIVPEYSQQAYREYVKNYHDVVEPKLIPKEYQGYYHRVKINEKNLATKFLLGENYMVIRNPQEIRYELFYAFNAYRVIDKDGKHGPKVGLYTSRSGGRYMLFDGTLYKKI